MKQGCPPNYYLISFDVFLVPAYSVIILSNGYSFISLLFADSLAIFNQQYSSIITGIHIVAFSCGRSQLTDFDLLLS